MLSPRSRSRDGATDDLIIGVQRIWSRAHALIRSVTKEAHSSTPSFTGSSCPSPKAGQGEGRSLDVSEYARRFNWTANTIFCMKVDHQEHDIRVPQGYVNPVVI
jgi:hypothetical protein